MSHLAWVNSLPESWEVKPLRATTDYVVSNVDKLSVDHEIPVRLCNYTDVYNNDFISMSLDFMQATATEDEIERFGLQVGDVVITKDSESWDDIGVPALVWETADDLVCGYHLALLRPRRHQLAGAFLFRCLQAKPICVQLELAANGVTRFGLAKSEIGSVTLPVPPLSIQYAIADYLDRETARLDALVAEKERLLELLAEKRRALITRAVTRGLAPNVPLRYSGIPWLGEIPAHWKVTLLRFACCSIETGGTPSIDYVDDTSETSVDWFTPGDFGSDLVLRESSRRLAQEAVSSGKAKLFPAGSVFVVSIGATLGKVGIIEAPASANQQINAMIPRGTVEPHFLAHVLWILGDVMGEMANSATLPILNQQRMGEIRVPIPPVSEQRVIVSAIASETKRIECVWVAAEHTIALLKERRSALIAAAVTGQIDVRSAP